MNAAADTADELARLQGLFARQRAACAQDPYPGHAARVAMLRSLRAGLRRHQDRIATAIDADFGGRSRFETKFVDLVGPVLEINHALRSLSEWMRPRRRRTELLFFSNRASVRYQPKGVVGIIAPWNFPVYLALGPLVAALAAGNRALIKMSEYTPRTTAAVQALVGECCAETEVAVIGGGVPLAQAFAALAFDHLVFTGSAAVGPEVMRAAAGNLTPLTLELGGKSPAILAPQADIRAAARSIAHGKGLNCGQSCVAPDYVLVPQQRVAEFAQAVADAFRELHPRTGAADYTAIITDRQLERLRSLIDDARAKGARIAVSGDQSGERRLPLHVITEVRADMRVAREEVFGPILPVIGYRDLAAAIAYVAARPRPLALYPHGFAARELEAVLRATCSGGVTVDDWGWHVFNHDLPFGGSGASGMGSYHGEEGFRELSHARAVFQRRRFFPSGLFRPPYGTWVQRLVLRLYLGRPPPQP
jgi:coniferyl-aldehyde dehydrogenase